MIHEVSVSRGDCQITCQVVDIDWFLKDPLH